MTAAGQAGETKAKGSSAGGDTEEGRSAHSSGVDSMEEAEEMDRGDAEPSQCFVFWCSAAVCFCPQGLPFASGTGQT